MKSPAGKGGSGPPPRSGAPSNPSVQAAATKASNPAPQSAKQAERKTPTPTYTPTYTPQSAKQPERKTPPTYTPKSPKEEERRTTPPPASKTPVAKTPTVTIYPPPKSRPPAPPDYSVPPILTGVPRGRFPDSPTTNQPPPNAPAPVSYPAYSPPPDAPPPQPILPKFSPLINSAFLIKQAPIDTVIFDNSNVNIAQMQDLLYADIGGVELINMSRIDLINGEEVIYSPIKNLAFIQKRYNPNNVIAIQPNETYFSRFAIDLIQRGMNVPTIDLDGNITITINDVADDEDVEIEVFVNGTIDLIEE